MADSAGMKWLKKRQRPEDELRAENGALHLDEEEDSDNPKEEMDEQEYDEDGNPIEK